MPIGSLAGGALATALGARQAIVIAAIVTVGSATVLLFSSPRRRRRDLPTRLIDGDHTLGH